MLSGWGVKGGPFSVKNFFVSDFARISYVEQNRQEILKIRTKFTLFILGNICYSCVILTVNAKALLCLDSWNKFTNLAIFGSVFIWFLFLVVYSYFWPTLPLAANMAGIIQLIATTPMFWFSLLLVCTYMKQEKNTLKK